MIRFYFIVLAFFFIGRNLHAQYDWSLVHNGSLSSLKDLFFLDDNVGWACGTSGVVLKTEDAGDNWNYLTLTPTQTLHEVFFINSSTGWLVGDGGIIFRTDDGGTNWGQASILAGISLEGVFFLDNNTGWVSGYDGTNGRVYKTTDGGYTWIDQSSGLTGVGGLWKFDFLSPSKGYVVGSAGIFKTENGGDSWISKGNPLGSLIEAIHMFDENKGWICGGNGSLAYTSDGWNNWIVVNTASTEQFWDLEFYNELLGLVVGANGAAYYTVDGGFNWYDASSSLLTGYTLAGLEITNDGTIFVCSEFELIGRGQPVLAFDLSIESYYGLDTLCKDIPVNFNISLYNAGPGYAQNATFIVTYNSQQIDIFEWSGFIPANSYLDVNLGDVQASESGIYICVISGDSVETNNVSQKYITVVDAPSVYSDQETICLGDSVELGAGGAYYYYWSGFADSLNPVQIVKPEITTSYEVKMVADYCTVYDTVLVTVDLCSELVTAISPNNDGKNDILYIDGISDKNNQVQIYNRWGDLIVSFVNYDNSTVFWDGTDALGQNVSDGTYYYIAQTDDQTIKISSWVQLIR